MCRLPTWVGDVVMATPALRAVRAAYPDARIILQGRPKIIDLLAGAELHDDGIPAASGRGAVAANVRELKAAAADLAIVFPHSFRSAWETFRAGVPLRIGYARQGRKVFLTHGLAPHRHGGRIVPVPMVFEYLELVAVAGAVGDDRGPELAIPESLRRAGLEALKALGIADRDRVVALNPGASFGPSKIWPVEHFAAAADAFARDGYRILVVVGPGEEALARQIASHMESEPVSTADALLPLDQVKVAMERADLVITTDAGPRHIATAVGTPTVVLMGPTDPRYSHSHLDRCMVLRRDVPCGPCHLKVCPIDHRCLRQILPDEVVQAGRKLLGQD